MKKYSREQILWAAKVGEVSMIDAEHTNSKIRYRNYSSKPAGRL